MEVKFNANIVQFLLSPLEFFSDLVKTISLGSEIFKFLFSHYLISYTSSNAYVYLENIMRPFTSVYLFDQLSRLGSVIFNTLLILFNLSYL